MFQNYLKDYFSLASSRISEEEVVKTIRAGVHMRGGNVWILAFAIVLASVGLNVNSTPGIIGAMLISPLMGPIMGIGLGTAIYDFPLIRSAFRNLGMMVLTSLLASTIYFLVSPLDQAQSELLSRTTPTIWDVMIAFFGGLAGIFAASTKEKGTVVPGVAIATALMPPLCTAGFGLAHGDWKFFLGAFYLFCINTVFIGIATLLTVRLLKFKTVTFVDEKRHARVRLMIIGLVVLMIVPSTIIAYKTVEQAVFEQHARSFVDNEIESSDRHVLIRNFDYSHDSITSVVIGKPLTDSELTTILSKRSHYSLGGVHVTIRQGLGEAHKSDLVELKKAVNQDMISMQLGIEKERSTLIADSLHRQQSMLVGDSLAPEVFALNSQINSFGLSRVRYLRRNARSVQSAALDSTTSNSRIDSTSATPMFPSDTLLTAYIGSARPLTTRDKVQLRNWLKARTRSDTVVLVAK